MSKKRNAGIIAYGTEEDRQKLALLADTYGVSGSEFIIRMIRTKFEELFGRPHFPYTAEVRSALNGI